jgi:hypothetical protein
VVRSNVSVVHLHLKLNNYRLVTGQQEYKTNKQMRRKLTLLELFKLEHKCRKNLRISELLQQQTHIS